MPVPTASASPQGHRNFLFWMRYVLPAVIAIAGVVILIVIGPDTGLDALSALAGAGGAVYLINALLRMGMSNAADRDVEEARRMFLDRYGAWPDEVPEGWRAPESGEDVPTTLRRLADEYAGDTAVAA